MTAASYPLAPAGTKSNRNQPKIFCIGLPKTGTTSLKKALRILGYNVRGPFHIPDPDNTEYIHETAFNLVEQYDAFEDIPWPILYQELDHKFPGSKFILTTRAPESWIESQVKHFGERDTAVGQWFYGAGCPKGNEAIYLERLHTHNQDVLAHYKDRPNDLLVMDITAGDGWEKLCPFLGHPIRSGAFPHKNTAENRARKKRGGWFRSIQRALKLRKNSKPNRVSV